MAVCGWILFVYEWIRVSRGTSGHEGATLGLVLGASLILIHGGMYAWVGHNKNIAKAGKRGLSTRYTSPVFTHDHLGRALVIDENVRSSQEILVSVNGQSKIYSVAKVSR